MIYSNKTIKTSLYIFVASIITCFAQQATENTVSGELKYLQSQNGRVFLAIDSNKRISRKADDGALVSSKLLQLAIPDAELGKKAMSLIGKQVTSKGEPMARHTQHHHTEVLWVVSTLEESLGSKLSSEEPRKSREDSKRDSGADSEASGDKKTPSQSLNPHSVEW